VGGLQAGALVLWVGCRLVWWCSVRFEGVRKSNKKTMKHTPIRLCVLLRKNRNKDRDEENHESKQDG